MKKALILKIVGVLFLLQIVTFSTISNYQLDQRVHNTLLEFIHYRLLKEKGDLREDEIYISSCGDEFFRNSKNIYTNINSLYKSEGLKGSNNYRSIDIATYNPNLVKLMEQVIGSGDDKIMFVNFNVCRILDTIFITELEYSEIFGTYADPHALLYNGHIGYDNVNYVWLFWSWYALPKWCEVANFFTFNYGYESGNEETINDMQCNDFPLLTPTRFSKSNG